MAALLRHGFCVRTPVILPRVALPSMGRDFSSSSSEKDLPTSVKLERNAVSLSCKGFLRSHKPYAPPEDVENQLFLIGKKYLGSKFDSKAKIDDSTLKFNLLAECSKVFRHCVPNSILHTIETFGDIVEFYHTPVTTSTPLDELKAMKLPPNLHIQHDYLRFHPDTDVMFGGLSAFPKSSTIVTGLKYKKKYKGFKAKTSWP